MPSILNATTSSGLVTSADNSGSLQLATNNGTTAVTVTTAQFVGIGETNPNTILHANGDIRSTNSASNFSRLSFGQYGSSGTSYSFIQGDARSTGYLSFYTNVTEQMKISSGGQVTMPNQPMCSVYSTTENYTGSTGSVVPFNVEQIDVGGNYNTSTYRFTAPVAGKYLATIYFLVRNATSASAIGFYKNGTQVRGRGGYGEPGSGNEVNATQTLIIDCAANDYIDARVSQLGNGDMYLGDLAGMQIYLIG